MHSCSIDLEKVEIEGVNEEVLRIKDYLVRSGEDRGSLCLLSAEDEIFFMCHQILQMLHLSQTIDLYHSPFLACRTRRITDQLCMVSVPYVSNTILN